jgi:hypothetical protein
MDSMESGKIYKLFFLYKIFFFGNVVSFLPLLGGVIIIIIIINCSWVVTRGSSPYITTE